jgi:type IV pilus assembly protein PilB
MLAQGSKMAEKNKLSSSELAPEPPLSKNMTHQKRMQIGEFLVQAGILGESDVEKALSVQKVTGGRLGSILVSLELCTEEAIRKALHDQLAVEVIDLSLIKPEPALFDLLSTDLMLKYQVIPLKKENGSLWIAMLDPYNLLALDDIRFKTDLLRLVVTTCTEADFKRFVGEHLVTGRAFEEVLRSGEFYNQAIKSLHAEEDFRDRLDFDEYETPLLAHKLKIASAESPIITLCNFFLLEAIRWQASDIHIEPYETSLRVRLRVDGHLRTILSPPKKLAAAIVARIKLMGEMDITRRRLPQDGQLSVAYEGEVQHFRVSTIPTFYGEKCVIRRLGNNTQPTGLDQLQLAPEDLDVFKKKLKEPQGLILLTGPAGSGKTTFVHAGLNYISSEDINIATLEDPVEATFFGINHVPVNKQGGITFASGLRSLLRQDPDVIYVGEIHDPEVAGIAMQASQTGHLVLSTLHTNSCVESIERLMDMGIPSYLIASSLLVIIAQRLVRRVCGNCAEPYSLSDDEVSMLGISSSQLQEATPRQGRGCKRCMGSGYRGRIAVYEFLSITREVRELIRKQAGSETILSAARDCGTRTLMEAGVEKVLRGETTPLEIRRVLMTEH